MKEKGIEPDVVWYTTIIGAYRKVKNYTKWWEIYDEGGNLFDEDEFLTNKLFYIIFMLGYINISYGNYIYNKFY